MPRRRPPSIGSETAGSPPQAVPELGVDIVRVERIRRALARFGDRFSRRILTPAEASHVRGRPEALAGRWAAKEAVSKVLGLGVRGVGWREIEIERLPTGQPAVRLHGRAARRAEQLGLGPIACSISHEAEFAVAVAYAVRTAGGRFVFPPDIEDRLEDRERRLLARLERIRGLADELRRSVGSTDASPDPRSGLGPDEPADRAVVGELGGSPADAAAGSARPRDGGAR